MKNNFRFRVAAFATAAFATLLGSCAYDPYYGSGSAGYGDSRTAVSYGTGYGHGYGGSSFSTSVFVSTGNPRWGYDPYCNSYYDFTRRSYYDPYLYGYYPIGYRPPIIVGVPHPHGWRPGRGYCPPPSRVTNVTLVNYRNRESAYRNTDHSWARNVHTDSRQMMSVRPQGRNEAYSQPSSRGNQRFDRPDNGSYTDQRGNQPPSRQTPGWGSGRQDSNQPPGYFDRSGNPQRQSGPQTAPSREQSRPEPTYNRGGDPTGPSRSEPAGRPSRFNTPVAVPPQPTQSRTTGRERPTFDQGPQRNAPEPRSAPPQRQAPQPRSAPPQRQAPEPRSAPTQADPRSSGDPREGRGQGQGRPGGDSGPSRGDRRLR